MREGEEAHKRHDESRQQALDEARDRQQRAGDLLRKGDGLQEPAPVDEDHAHVHQPVAAALQHDQDAAAEQVPDVAQVHVVPLAPDGDAARDLHGLVHQVQEAFGPDEVPGDGDLGQPPAMRVALDGLKLAVHLHHDQALCKQDGQAPDGEEELHQVHLACARPESKADGAADDARLEEREALVHLRRLHQSAEEVRVYDVGDVADPHVHVPPRPAPVPVEQFVPLRVCEFGLVVTPGYVVLVKREEVITLVQHLPQPVCHALWREAHPGGQRMPAHALAVRLGRDCVDQGHRGVGGLPEEPRQVVLLEARCKLLAADAPVRRLADTLQEAGDAVGVVVDEDPQRGRRQGGLRGELHLRHPPEGDAHLQR
mmetsp:Transcript_130902/g.407063  ORF Transcript_130902/g.407063 Transcript_130902/m.407063 type:complete len:370 (-) Transcript_130902:730-1839(-)